MIKPLENLLSDNSLQTSKISLVVLDSIILMIMNYQKL